MSKKSNAMKQARRRNPKHLRRKGRKNPLFGASLVSGGNQHLSGLADIFMGLIKLGVIPENKFRLKPADLETMETPEGVQ